MPCCPQAAPGQKQEAQHSRRTWLWQVELLEFRERTLNSQLLLKSALQQFEHDQKYEITEVRLRDYNISPCNGCYSTTSSLCGFPCNCFPLDPMQELYPL